jgi:hypothetical protein
VCCSRTCSHCPMDTAGYVYPRAGGRGGGAGRDADHHSDQRPRRNGAAPGDTYKCKYTMLFFFINGPLIGQSHEDTDRKQVCFTQGIKKWRIEESRWLKAPCLDATYQRTGFVALSALAPSRPPGAGAAVRGEGRRTEGRQPTDTTTAHAHDARRQRMCVRGMFGFMYVRDV